jgi:hypothetical protein
MIQSTSLMPLLHVSKFFNLPPEITRYIYLFLINDSAQLIIDKWYSFILIHNTNLVHIVNNLMILHNQDFLGYNIFYYNLNDLKLRTTLIICLKYIKPSISDKHWWLNFSRTGFNGLLFINSITPIVQHNINLLQKLYRCFP